MDFVFLIILVVLFVIGVAIDSLMAPKISSISTYDDNGKRLTIKINTLPDIPQTEDCLPDSLKVCDMNDKFSCGRCKEPLATCHHIPIDMTIEVPGSKDIVIKANKNKQEGYCLTLNASGSARTCTRKNGGKWILVLNPSQTLYRFECFCSQHNYFVNSPIDNDCTQFVGCINGKMKSNDWNKFEDIECTCKQNFESSRIAFNSPISEAPQCVLKNIFKWEKPPFPVLEKKFIDPVYLDIVTPEISLPNPCLYDLATNTFSNDIGEIVLDTSKNIAYCRALKIGYTTAITNSDYLLNNNGNYANCLTSFTKNVQDLVKRKDEIIYEYQRTKVNTKDNVLRGVRIYYNDFKFKLNYLDPNSGNMNGPGIIYSFAPTIPKNRIEFAYVYVYNAPTPTPLQLTDIKLGSMMYWCPFFNTRGGIESSKRVYNGIVPLKGGSTESKQMVFYPLPPVPTSCKKLAGFTGLYSVSNTDASSEEYAFHYALPLTLGNNFLSRKNTGVIMNYNIKDKLYSKPLSCGSLDLTQKYRYNFNPKFSVLAQGMATSWMYYRSTCDDHYLADEKDEHMWPETSYGLDSEGIGGVEPYHGRYKVENNKVEFCTFFS